MSYHAPIDDIKFCLDHILDSSVLYSQEFDQELRDAVLEASADIANDILAPINHLGDKHGTQLIDGKVMIRPEFMAAIKAFSDGGWQGLTANPDHGGQGLPRLMASASFELFQAANMAFSLMPTLNQAAIEAIETHGSEAQKQLYLPKLITGEWIGTMNLTEPQAGSDLAALTLKAEPQNDGSYKLTGQKIFITWGDHQGAKNIIHLVLGRLPEAPLGSKGISLFICSKFDPITGAPNTINVAGLEHKMGIHASPTCVMAYDGAKAELIGPINGGLAAMFTMMNAARLAVGVQGVGIAERAYQQALTYAKDRIQGPTLLNKASKSSIYDHPDVRLMIGLMAAKIMAGRAICLATALAGDHAKLSDGEVKARLKRREDFLVPIAKAWGTDMGVEVTSIALQVHGGMGFIEETGAAQHYRDARIAPIYEGTNGIQALDLVGRKLGRDGTAAFELKSDLESYMVNNSLSECLKAEWQILSKALEAFETATNWILGRKIEAPADVATAASAYLKLCGDLLGGFYLLKGAESALVQLKETSPKPDYLNRQIGLARLYGAHVLSHAPTLLQAITMGSEILTKI